MKLSGLPGLTKTSVKIDLTSSNTDKNGSNVAHNSFNTDVRFEDSNFVTYTTEGKKVTAKQKVFTFNHLNDFPEKVTGFVTSGTTRYEIVGCTKLRNPDSTLNHIVLELI